MMQSMPMTNEEEVPPNDVVYGYDLPSSFTRCTLAVMWAVCCMKNAWPTDCWRTAREGKGSE